MVLKAFHLALRDAFEARERNAEGDYRPDPKAERFPSFEQAPVNEPPSPSAAKRPKPKGSLTGILADWWTEAKAGGRTVSTHESYGRTMRQFAAFLGHDDASRVTAEDVIRFKDHRISEGLSIKTVRDSDLAALRSVFSWAVANRRMGSNPADGIKLKRPRRCGRGRKASRPMRRRPCYAKRQAMWRAPGSTQRRRRRSVGLHGSVRIPGRGSGRLSNSASKTFGLQKVVDHNQHHA